MTCDSPNFGSLASPASFKFYLMTTFAEHRAEPNAEAENEARTGVPGITTWRGIYLAVLGIFVVLVLVMWGFEIHYS
ncbi:MAG: hypothetical protein SynsKO_34480 [Synoicihabitans sp.]